MKPDSFADLANCRWIRMPRATLITDTGGKLNHEVMKI